MPEEKKPLGIDDFKKLNQLAEEQRNIKMRLKGSLDVITSKFKFKGMKSISDVKKKVENLKKKEESLQKEFDKKMDDFRKKYDRYL